MDLLAYPLTAPLARGPHQSLAAWSDLLTTCPYAGPLERALWGGFHADRIAYAFVAGYSAALARLVSTSGSRPFPARLSLCATEAAGAHPRNIATRLEEQKAAFVLNGEKTFATLASSADELLVVASQGTDSEGRKRLRLVRVRPDAHGVDVVDKRPLPFAPELPHALVRFVDVVVADDDILPGDGYEQYLKPFRTLEDTHVLLATTGYLIAAARAHGFEESQVAELAALALALLDVGERDPLAPLTHVLLAGLFGTLRRLVPTLAWERGSAEERARWERDQPILLVAEAVRSQRTTAAWRALTA